MVGKAICGTEGRPEAEAGRGRGERWRHRGCGRTALNLKLLESILPKAFPEHVRLVTGASGGMLGASYYVASLREAQMGMCQPGAAEIWLQTSGLTA